MAISDACSQAGLAKTDIYNSKYVPTKTDDSIIGGDMGLVEIDGNKVVAGPDTPSEFIIDEKGGFTFNPDFLKRMGYDRLGDLSVLIPRKNAEAWKNISFDGKTVVGTEIEDGNDGKAPPAPSSVKVSGTNITWSGATGHLIVGYRIYYAPEDSNSFKSIGHTIKPSYSLPNHEGKYHIVAVNYFGVESKPSSVITVEVADKDDDKEKDDKKDKKKQDKDKNKNKGNDKDNEKPIDDKQKDEENKNDDGETDDEHDS